MKNLFTILLLTIFSLASFAESDANFQTICQGNMWHSYVPGKGDNFTFIGSEETVIDGKVYYSDVNNNEYYYRQDDEKVYRYSLPQQSEELVIDYGLQVNNIFTHADGSEWIVALVKDTTLTGLSSPRLCIELVDVDNSKNTDMWIEGIGSIHYGINPPSYMDDVSDYYILSFATREWEACVFTFKTSNLCNKIVAPEDNGEDASGKQLHIEVSLVGDVLHVEGDAWYDGAGWWYILAEEKDGVVNLTHSETVPDADGLTLRSFSVDFEDFNQPVYDVFYNGEYITRVNNNAEHEYIPLLSPTSEWVELTYKAYVRYAISDTATINNKEYCVISCTEILLPEKEIHHSNSKIYIREEDKRVYLYDEYAPEEEYLLFDFGAKAGDKIVVNNTTNEDWVIAIDRVETINLNGIERNMLHVSYICNNEDLVTNDTWIEGIGSTQFSPFINIIRWGGTGLGYFHYFYDYNTDFIYPEDATPYDFGTSTIVEYIPLLSPGKAWVETDGHIFEEYMIKDTTMWDKREYCELRATAIELPQGNFLDSNTKEYLREEDKKIFRYLPQNSACPIPEWIATEHLLFDFGAKAGENIVVIDSQDYKLVMTIDSIKQIVLDDRERDVFYVSYFNNDEKTGNEIWIEGIGTTITPLFDEYVRKWGIFVGATFFHYFYDYNTDFIYPEDREVIDFSDVSTIPTDANAMTIHREGETVVAVFPAAGVGETITLYDTTGRIVAVESVQEGATSATIDIAHLPQGVYIARMNSGASCKVVL
ncbi:MAG: T9SS type A sorting domain-containing protein [Bacteroidaceae bacterium]|nr:T9SS type A sorting domain-containing protein [Bacteroidales bacterium]MBR6758446.1 T9SS type A sorting domain-containing protein [Bacteroidaceae bacterium]